MDKGSQDVKEIPLSMHFEIFGLKVDFMLWVLKYVAWNILFIIQWSLLFISKFVWPGKSFYRKNV